MRGDMKNKCECDVQKFNTCTCDHEPKFAKPAKKKKRPKKTAEDTAHMSWVASQGCMICGGLACVHHVRKNGEPRDHRKTIPLCYNHHQGVEGIHTRGKKEWWRIYGNESDLLEELMQRLV